MEPKLAKELNIGDKIIVDSYPSLCEQQNEYKYDRIGSDKYRVFYKDGKYVYLANKDTPLSSYNGPMTIALKTEEVINTRWDWLDIDIYKKWVTYLKEHGMKIRKKDFGYTTLEWLEVNKLTEFMENITETVLE